MSNPGDDAREVMAKDRLQLRGGGPANPQGILTNETLHSFDKMRPGEVDKIFQAVCPQCDSRVWIFTAMATGPISEMSVDHDARQCENCGYVHWLRGPNTSKVVPLPSMSSAYPAKKDRVRTLVLALLASPRDCRIVLPSSTPSGPTVLDIVQTASKIDDEIESSK